MAKRPVGVGAKYAEDCTSQALSIRKGTRLGDEFYAVKAAIEQVTGFPVSAAQVLSRLLNEFVKHNGKAPQ